MNEWSEWHEWHGRKWNELNFLNELSTDWLNEWMTEGVNEWMTWMNEMTWHDMKQNEIKNMKHMKLYIYVYLIKYIRSVVKTCKNVPFTMLHGPSPWSPGSARPVLWITSDHSDSALRRFHLSCFGVAPLVVTLAWGRGNENNDHNMPVNGG